MRRKSLSRESILKAAGDLVSEQGVNECTIRLLASRLDIAVGTVYNYFPSREDLLHDLFHSSWNDTFRKIGEFDQDASGSVKEAVEGAVAIVMDDIAARNGLGKEVIGSRKGFEDIRKDIEKSLTAIIEKRTSFSMAEAQLRSRWILAVLADQMLSEDRVDEASLGLFLQDIFPPVGNNEG